MGDLRRDRRMAPVDDISGPQEGIHIESMHPQEKRFDR